MAKSCSTLATPWTVTLQTPPWNSQACTLEWLPCLSSKDLPDPGIKSRISCIAGGCFPAKPGEAGLYCAGAGLS